MSKPFEITEKQIVMDIEKEPNTYRPKYIIDKKKVKLMKQLNNNKPVWRYVEGFDKNYALSSDGEMYRYEKRSNEWKKVKFTQVKNNLQTKLTDSNGKRHTKKLTLLMKEVFPELITYNTLKIEEEKQKGENELIKLKKQQEATIKCYNNFNKEVIYFMSVKQAAKATKIDEINIEKNLRRELDSIGGLTFYYN